MHDPQTRLSHLSPSEAFERVLQIYHDPGLTRIRSRRLDIALAELRAALSGEGEFVAGPDECDTGAALTKAIESHLSEHSNTMKARLKSDDRRVFHFDTLTLPDWLIALSPSILYTNSKPTLEVGNRKVAIGEWVVETDSNGVNVFTDENFRNTFDVVPE